MQEAVFFLLLRCVIEKVEDVSLMQLLNNEIVQVFSLIL